jgi:glycopeptide antibiotics resistance protein
MQDPSLAYQHMAAGMFGIVSIIVLICLVFVLFLFGKILSKAGMSPWLTVINVLPFGTIIVLCILAFGEWPSTFKRIE